MKRLITLAVLLILVGIILLGVQGFILAQPEIPHRLEDREDCLSCHADETNVGIPQMPEEEHDWHTSNSCQKCHDPVASYAPLTPHKLIGREDCVSCHLPEAAAEELAATQSTTTLPGGLPLRVMFVEQTGEVDNCVVCHLAEGSELEAMAHSWEISVHSDGGATCVNCHGGDPNAEDMEAAKAPETGYVGMPERAEIPDLCGSCHADVNLMRQYDLPTDQLAKYRESFHGQQLTGGDTKVAICTDCHNGHEVLPSNDPQSSTYILNVPYLCADCHADEDYMADYLIPTNQFALYETSVHGVALLEHQDTRAPNCATCHGTHGAAPPGFAEVANVCGSCHDATQNYYTQSAHFSTDPETPRCVTCHGRYDVQPIAEDTLFVDAENPRSCVTCHDTDSEIGGMVAEMYQSIVDADEAMIAAEHAMEEAAALGMIVNEEEVLLTEAFTKLTTARAAQHTADLDVVKLETDAAIELSETARQLAEEAISENESRRQAMVIVIAIIAVTIGSLLLIRRELIHARSR